MGLIPSLLEDSDSKDVKSFEEAEDIAALGAVAFFGKLGLVQTIQRSHILHFSISYEAGSETVCCSFVSSFF